MGGLRSLLALGEAFQTIRRGSAEAMLAGATGSRLHPMKAVHSRQQEELADGDTEPARASRPFDPNRTGMVLGEGAGAVVLEEKSHAEARGVTIYGEVLSAATSSACDRNRVAHRDRAIQEVFGRRSRPVPVTAAKSYFGNLGAGSGMIETACALLSWTHDRLFPILNYQTPDPDCPIAAVTDPDTLPGDSFLRVNVTPQGQAAVVLVRRV